jgi:hypothetical protein
MVRHGLKHIFQKPTPDIDASDRTQQLRAKTIYAGTVDLAKTLVKGNNTRYKTYNGPYEVSNNLANSNLIASQSYDDLLAITKGKVLLNQLPLNSYTQKYYQENFAKGQMYEGNYNQFDPSFNFIGHTGCNNSVLVYDISTPGFTGPASYDTNDGFIGVTGPGPTGISTSNKHIFVDPNHCYYSDPCLLDASYTRFVSPGLTGATGPAQFNAQKIINADQYRGFSYPMPNFTLMCAQEIPDQQIGPLFCPQPPTPITAVMWEYTNSPPTDLTSDITPTYNGSSFTIGVKSVRPSIAKFNTSGVASVTNVLDPPAQLTLTGSENFTGSVKSPSIRVVHAPLNVTWEYTADGTSYNDLTGDITPAYTSSTFAIRAKTITPSIATFAQSGVASVINVGDPPAQLVITGSRNFTGSVITSPSIRVNSALFTATWEYTNDGGSSYFDLTGDITPAYTSSTFTIRAKTITPSTAAFTQSGVASITNVGDPQAQVMLTGFGNFAGSINTSPSIRVVHAPLNVTWEYTTDGGTSYSDLASDITPAYTASAFAIRAKTITPSTATFTQSGVASITNVGDPPAQLVITGSGNFAGSVNTSPSIRVATVPFTATWQYTTDGGTSYSDLTGDITPAYTASAFAIRLKGVVPLNATFNTSGIASITNVGDPLAQLIITGTGNFAGSVNTSPSIRVVPSEINIYNKSSGTITPSENDPPNFNGNGNNLILGYTTPLDTSGNYYVSSATNPSLHNLDSTKPLYLHFFKPLDNPANIDTNPNAQVWTQHQTYWKGKATLTFVAAESKYVSNRDEIFFLQAGQVYWTIWSQFREGAFNPYPSTLSMLIDDGGTGNWQWQGTLNVTKV